ncbi:hypothetical protein MTO96_042561 [Rhipicephalus appendiculatus]
MGRSILTSMTMSGVLLLAEIRRRLVTVALRCYDYGNAAIHASNVAGSRGHIPEDALLIQRSPEVNLLLTDPRHG